MNVLFRGRTAVNWTSIPGQVLIFGLLFSMISISLAEAFLSLALIFWAVATIKDKRKIRVPRFFLPLIVYAGFSLVAAGFSVNPAVSFRACREILLFCIVPVIYMSLHSIGEIRKANLAFFASAGTSLIYSLYYVLFKALPGERIKGFMGHYMTQSGLLVLFCSLALALWLFERKKVRFLWGAGFIVALPFLVLTMTRSAWIGLGVMMGVLIFLYRPKLLAVLPVLAALAYFASPGPVKDRVRSIFTSRGYSNRVRLEYVRAGIKIIRDFPLTGTGPDTVDMVFQNPKYGLSEDAKLNRTHLHNNFLQIAAERGIPALLVWLIFIVWTSLDLIRTLKNKDPGSFPLAAGALAAVAALVVSGCFEYNIGDSEVVILFFYLITVPFAALMIGKEERTNESGANPSIAV